MPVVISNALVLSTDVEGGPNAPLIGWHNLVTAGEIEADEEDANYPATNLANPSTALRWQAETTGAQTIEFTVSSAEAINYVGIARHNLGSGQVNIGVDVDDVDDPGNWLEVVAESLQPHDGPLVLAFEPVFTTKVRLRLTPDAVIPRIAVVYIGALLRLQRGLQPGFTPPPWAASDDAVATISESGDYLGQVVLRQSLAFAVSMQWIDYDWWNANMAGFIRHARRRQPFFFAWMPATYPDEAGYDWTQSDLRPEMQTDLTLNVSFDLRAVSV